MGNPRLCKGGFVLHRNKRNKAVLQKGALAGGWSPLFLRGRRWAPSKHRLCCSQAVLYPVTETLPWFEFYTAAPRQDLVPCATCGRRFTQDVLLRHDPICKKVFNKKRKPFNSLKQRLQGTEITTVKRQPPQKKQPGKKSNWRQHHEDFINAIRAAKQVTKALEEGRPLPPPPPPSINPDYIQCPHCSRRFNEAAAERHMKFCKEQAVHRAFTAKMTRQALGKQPVTQKKPPPLTTAVLSLQKRVQEGASADQPVPKDSPGVLKKTKKALGVSAGKNPSGEFGPQMSNRR